MSRVYGLFMILVITGTIIAAKTNKSELRFVTVVFRHADRAPDDNGKELYPNDPYVNYNFEPMGLGGLTNSGKRREFSLGKVLRKRYDDFLGKIYIPDDIVARSTDYDRTKMSMALVLASLYPPEKSQIWTNHLSWQPIPMSYIPRPFDVLLIPDECPRYMKELERVRSLPEVMAKLEEFRPLMKNLTILTGKPMKNSNDMYYLYLTLAAEYSMNLTLPKWTKSLFPRGPLLDATILEYEIMSYNDKLKRINGGTLVKRISEDMVAAVKNVTKNARKINLFSGHETNIAALLQTLGVYKPHVPEFSSAIFIELIRQNDEHYVKVLYFRGIPAIVETLKIPDCEELCLLDDFLRLMENVTPTNDELVCRESEMDSWKITKISRRV